MPPRRKSLLLFVTSLPLFVAEAHAIRPFVTDDARVVGRSLAQLETWILVDRLVVEHNALAAIGPTDWLELTLGTTHGRVKRGNDRSYSITGPIAQAKALLLPTHDNGKPGFAVAAGVLPPLGYGEFAPPGWSGFGYMALTASLGHEALLIHANLGLALGEASGQTSKLGFGAPSGKRVRTLLTAGVGAQARVIAGLHAVAEVYRGDPYDPRTNFAATQGGFRYIFSDHLQIDGTVGTTLAAVKDARGHSQTEQWLTLGLRLVSGGLW